MIVACYIMPIGRWPFFLLVACYSMLFTSYLNREFLLLFCYILLITSYSLLIVTLCFLVVFTFVACHFLFVACYVLLLACFLLVSVRYLLLDPLVCWCVSHIFLFSNFPSNHISCCFSFSKPRLHSQAKWDQKILWINLETSVSYFFATGLDSLKNIL